MQGAFNQNALNCGQHVKKIKSNRAVASNYSKNRIKRMIQRSIGFALIWKVVLSLKECTVVTNNEQHEQEHKAWTKIIRLIVMF